MMAFLPSESGSWDRDGQNLLVVLGIKNKLKAWNFAEKLQKEEGKEITKTKYKGVTIYLETSTDSDEQGATAILDNYNKVVFSENIETIKLAIDTYKGEKTSFVANPEAKKALNQKLGLKNPIFAFYLADYGELIGKALASASNQELSTETLEQLMAVESAVMGLGFEDKGLRLKYLVNLNQSALKREYKPEKGKIVSRFPESTIALMTGSKVNESWWSLVEQSEVVPQLDQLLNGWETMLGSINLDLNEDVFGWMDGEVGLGLVTVDEGIFKDYGMGGAAIFQTSDRQTATNTLKKLEELAAGNSFITIDRRSIKGKTIVEWIADNKVLLSYGWTDDRTLTVALGTPFKELMEVKGKNSLAGSKNFKDLAGSLPEKNFGYFYLDMKKLMAVLNNLPSAPSNYLPPESKAVLDSIRGIAATSTMGDRSTAELDLLLHLEPNN